MPRVVALPLLDAVVFWLRLGLATQIAQIYVRTIKRQRNAPRLAVFGKRARAQILSLTRA